MEVYLTSISFELDKKINQTATCLYFKPLYHIFIQSWSIYSKKILALFEVFKKCYAKLFDKNIHKLEKKSTYIIAF